MEDAQQQNNQEFIANPDVNFFAATNFRNQSRKFGIKTDDRRRHMYVVGKTGMGKTTMLENMVLNDIYAGNGVGVIDPHGDFAEKIINFIPPKRINDVVYFNPADVNYPIGFNILETINPDHKHLVAAGLMAIFKKIWEDMWSSRMEYILNNTLLSLLDFPGTTLLGINRMLADANYRKRIVRNVKDPVVKAFWLNEFASYNDRYAQEAVAPIQNKIGQFLSASVIRNIVAQVKSRINIREIMDNKKIFIMNLSKGRIGEDNSRLLGGMLITKLQLSAMERVDMPEDERPDFFLYVDEFQNFATSSFAHILSEARKYHLSLIMAHQYMEQLDETVLAAVIGNVGTISTFRVGSTDAEVLAKEFVPTFTEPDLINLAKFNIYLKLMIDGVASRPFSATTLPPIGLVTDSAESVIKVSRERYAIEREKIEDKIAKWSGMDIEDVEEEIESSPSKAGHSPDKKQKSFNSKKGAGYSVKSKTDKIGTKRQSNTKSKQESLGTQKFSHSKPAESAHQISGSKKINEEFQGTQPPSNGKKISIVDTSQKGASLNSLKSGSTSVNKKKNFQPQQTENKHPYRKSAQGDKQQAGYEPSKSPKLRDDVDKKNRLRNFSYGQVGNQNKSKFTQNNQQKQNLNQPKADSVLGFVRDESVDKSQSASSGKVEKGKVVKLD